jgi:dihydropteroate synthase
MFLCGQYRLNLKNRTHIMGILNITPDSFYKESRVISVNTALKRADKMIREGADILDIGGESSRPGSNPVSEEEELKRILPVINGLIKKFDIPVSVDTYKSAVARTVLEEGVSIINDISGLRFDPSMAKTIASANAGVIIMHISGKPKTMQKNPSYKSLMREITAYLKKGIKQAVSSDIKGSSIIVDPGIGFGKNFSHNITILKKLKQLQKLKKPILLGLSRKSFIGKILDLPVEERLEGSIAASVFGILNGAQILRTHDVKETKRALAVADAIIH